MKSLTNGKRIAIGAGLLISALGVGGLRLDLDGSDAPLRTGSPSSSAPTTPADSDFLAEAQAHIAAREYWASETKDGLQAPNRKQALRSYFEPTGVRVHDRTGAGSGPLLGLQLVGLGRGAKLSRVAAGELSHHEGRVEIARAELGLTEWFENSEQGLEQGFTLAQRPPSQATTLLSTPRTKGEELIVELSVSGSKASLRGEEVVLTTDAGRKLSYGKLAVVDAGGQVLEAHFEVPESDRIRLVVDDEEASYPVVIDPLLSAAAETQLESNQPQAFLGQSVAAAGDVNGDGYDDVIVGAEGYDAGQSNEGAAFVFLGSGSGVADGNPATAATQLESDQPNALLGGSVSGAGDVNGDGYADVIVGASSYDAGQTDEGAAFVFLGSASGVADGNPMTAATRLESDQETALLGGSVAGAGDVNGDGYGDVIVGAVQYDAGQTDEGTALLFLGSASGVVDGNPTIAATRLESDQAGARLGASVAGAGDVNGDGYGDVIVGANLYNAGQPADGAAFVFLGSGSGIAHGNPATAATQLDSNQGGAELGGSVAGAGDVNGDGYADVIVGAHYYDAGQTDEGAAFVFLGSASGVADGIPLFAAAQLESNEASAEMGFSVSAAGDLNGDGYGDVIVGTPFLGVLNNGAAFVYLGSASGVADGNPTTAAARVDTNLGNSWLGRSLAGAGDVNGDGYADVIVGAPIYDAGQGIFEGAAFVYHGGPTGIGADDPLRSGLSINLVGLGIDVSFQFPSIGASFAPAGDVNGDGFGDAIIGIPLYDGAQVDSGAVFVVHGSPTGLKSAATQFLADAQIFGDQTGGQFGYWVSSAGDVNGDGYGDVIVASQNHSAGQVNEGAAFVFLGSATGIVSGTTASAQARLETNQDNAGIDHAAAAGDINGDGYGDVLVSSRLFDSGTTDEGAAFVFLGSAAGIANGNPSTAHARFETDQALAGARASSAGDLNGDGFGDVVVHSESFDSGEADEGAAFVLLGSSAGITNGTPATAHARFETNQADVGGLSHSFSPGDVNGDGYADLLVSVPFFTNGESREGAVFLFNGSGSGMVNGNPATANTRIESNLPSAQLGSRVWSSTALDVNADGFADLLLSSIQAPPGPAISRFYHGSAAGIPNGDLSSASSTFGSSSSAALFIPGGDINGDGHGDVIIYSVGLLPQFPGFIATDMSVGSILSDRAGRPSLARQRRGDGSGILVSPGGESRASQFVAELFARSPRGREYGKLEVEYCPGTNAVFGAPSCLRELSPSWADLGTTGAVLTRTIPGLVQATPYIWRARARYASYHPTPPGAAIDGVAGPWYRVQGRPLATDIRTPAPEPNAVIALAVGGLLIAGLAKGRGCEGRRLDSRNRQPDLEVSNLLLSGAAVSSAREARELDTAVWTRGHEGNSARPRSLRPQIIIGRSLKRDVGLAEFARDNDPRPSRRHHSASTA